MSLSILLKRKLIASIFAVITIITILVCPFLRFDLVYLSISLFASGFAMLLLSITALRSSSNVVHMFRRKNLDEREQNEVQRNTNLIIRGILAFVLIRIGVGAAFNAVSSYSFYPQYESNQIIFWLSVFIFNFDTLSIFGEIGIVSIALLFAIPLLRDRDVEDEQEEKEYSRFKKQSIWIFKAVSAVIIIATISGFASYTSLRNRTSRVIDNLEQFTSIRSTGNFDVNIVIAEGPTKLTFSGPEYLVGRFDYAVRDQRSVNADGYFSNHPTKGKELRLISTSRKSISSIFGKLTVTIQTPKLDRIETDFNTINSFSGGCMSGEVVEIIARDGSNISNLCVNATKQLNINYYPGYSYLKESLDSLIVTSQIKIPLVEAVGQSIDISRVSGNRLNILDGYFNQTLRYNRSQFDEVKDSLIQKQ